MESLIPEKRVFPPFCSTFQLVVQSNISRLNEAGKWILTFTSGVEFDRTGMYKMTDHRDVHF